MKLPLVLILLKIIVQYVHGDGYCKAFECYEIKQYSDQPRTGVLTSGRKFPVMPCDNGNIGDTSSWKLPSNVASNAKCIAPTAEVITNSPPGDKGKTSADCFNTRSAIVNGANSTVCTTTKQIGDSGYDNDKEATFDQICPVGSYCKIDSEDPTKSIGAEVKYVGQNCALNDRCAFGLLGIASDLKTDFTNFKCADMHTLTENYTFSIANFPDSQLNNRLNGVDHAGKSYNSFDTDVLKKRRKGVLGDVSKDADEISLSRTSGAGVNCSYTSYDISDSKTTHSMVDYSMCGFNTGTEGYGRKRKGDKWFVSEYQIYGSYNITNANCHVSSTGENCVDLLNMFSKNRYDINDWYKALKDIDKDYGWPLYADNDVGVQKTITNSYWKIDPSDSAISVSYSFALALFIIFAVIIY